MSSNGGGRREGKGSPLPSTGSEDRYSFPPSRRIRKRKDLDLVFREGSLFSTPSITIRYRKNNLPFPRLGMILSRKIGKAVYRNRIKRWIREVFRKNQGEIPGYDCVVLVSPHSPPSSYRDVASTWSIFVQQIGNREENHLLPNKKTDL